MEVKIKELREEKKLSTYQMAKLMNITQSAYYRFESGNSKIELSKLELFAHAIGMSVVDVLVWPEHYINVRDLSADGGSCIPDVTLQLKIKGQKREAVLSAIFGDDNVEVIGCE